MTSKWQSHQLLRNSLRFGIRLDWDSKLKIIVPCGEKPWSVASEVNKAIVPWWLHWWFFLPWLVVKCSTYCSCSDDCWSWFPCYWRVSSQIAISKIFRTYRRIGPPDLVGVHLHHDTYCKDLYRTGWWFGTFFIFHIHGIILPIDFHIFQDG